MQRLSPATMSWVRVLHVRWDAGRTQGYCEGWEETDRLAVSVLATAEPGMFHGGIYRPERQAESSGIASRHDKQGLKEVMKMELNPKRH